MYKTYNARPLPQPYRQKRTPRIVYVLLSLLLLFAAYTAYALLRPLPPLETTITPPVMPALVKVNIPWPASAPAEQSAFGADGYGLLASKGPETPLPMASVTKTITAMVIMDKKPLKIGEQGPAIPLSDRDTALFREYLAKDGSVVPVRAGESITEYQALQALMLSSANNIADTLAIWAFGSVEAYSKYATDYVRRLGLEHTTVTDASGFAPTTVSTASDLVRLGDAALDNPVLAEIVTQKTAEFPGVGTIRNVNSLLGQYGILGIKTGNTDEAGGCFLGAADIVIGTRTVRVITAVMAAPNRPQALRDTIPLVQSAPSQFQTIQLVKAGQRVGTVSSAWGSSSAIVASQDISILSWAGSSASLTASKSNLGAPSGQRTKAGNISAKYMGSVQTSELQLAQAIGKPDAKWRMTHPW